MATLLYDTFTDADGTLLTAHTMNVGPGWTAVAGTFKVLSNKATPNSDVDDDRVVTDAGKADYVLQCDVAPTGAFITFSRAASLLVRYTDSTHYWLLDINVTNISANTLSLFENNGSSVFRAGANPTILTETTYTVTMAVVGQSITVSLNGVVQFVYTGASSSQSATKVGFRLGSSGGTRPLPTWDNLLVTDLPQAQATYVRPATPNWGGLWLRNLPHTPVFLPGAQSPLAPPAPQVLPGPHRPGFPQLLGLAGVPQTPMPRTSPPSLDSRDVQKYPPPVRLSFPLVPLLGLRVTGAVPTVPVPPVNPPATPAQQIMPPPARLTFPVVRLLGLSGVPVTLMPAGPSVAPTPPGPPTITSGRGKPFLQRVPTLDDQRRLARHTEILSSFFNAAVGKGQIQQTGPTDWKIVSGGFEAPRPPGVNDDNTIGVTPGAVWIDTTAGTAWVNIVNAVGAAVWQLLGSSSGGGGSGWTGTG